MATTASNSGAGASPAHANVATLAGIVLAVTALRLAALWITPFELGFDEAQYWVWSRNLAFGYFTKPPLIAWAIAGTSAVCGDGQACVRALSPVAHGVTAFLIYGAALQLYSRKAAFWAALVYLTIPGIAVSSFLITTDALLLLFWSMALLALVSHRNRPHIGWAVLFGLAVGFGLNAKYAMVYLPVLVVPAAIFDARMRSALTWGHIVVALAIASALIAPNVIWNLDNGLATVTHTGQNIGWSLDRLNIKDGFEFFGAQFGVAGPIVFGAMIAGLLYKGTDRPDSDRLMKWLSWPVVAMITIQGFLSQANANWGATAYPAGVIFATALLVMPRERGWFLANNLVNFATTAGVLVFLVAGPGLVTAKWAKPLRHLSGWAVTAQNLSDVAAREAAPRIVVVGRSLTAGLIYALRDSEVDVLAYRDAGGAAYDQFQLDRPWHPGDQRQGTLLFGASPELAAGLGARLVETIEAPLYLDADGRMDVYSLEP